MFFKQNQLYMILQSNPHLKIERLLGGVKPRCTKLDRNFFLRLFNVFFVDFRLAEYIYFFTLFTLFFWPTWQNCSKLGAEKLSTLNVAAFPGQGSLFSDKRFFWKENKSNRPHVWAIRSKRKRKSRPGASSKRPRGGGGRIMLWEQDVLACSAEGNILLPSSVIKIWSVHYACLCLSPPRLSPSPRLQLQFGLFQSTSIAFVCKNKIVRLRNIRMFAYDNPILLIWGTPHKTERMLMRMWKMRTWDKIWFWIYWILWVTTVKEYNRITKMSWRFSLHCITTVTWGFVIEIIKLSHLQTIFINWHSLTLFGGGGRRRSILQVPGSSFSSKS